MGGEAHGSDAEQMRVVVWRGEMCVASACSSSHASLRELSAPHGLGDVSQS